MQADRDRPERTRTCKRARLTRTIRTFTTSRIIKCLGWARARPRTRTCM